MQKQRSFNNLNKLEVSVSYNEDQRARIDLTRFSFFESKNEGVPTQATLAKTYLPLVRSIILIIVIDHLCPENSVIMTLL